MNGRATEAGEVLVLLAQTVERLSARVNRELHPEMREAPLPLDPDWASAIDDILECAEECLSVLDHPTVSAALDMAERAQRRTVLIVEQQARTSLV